MKSSNPQKMIIFSWPTIEKSFVKIFSGYSGISYWSKVCSGQPGLSIAPTLGRFGRVQVKNDDIEKKVEDGVTVSPPKKTAHFHNHTSPIIAKKHFSVDFS